MFASARVLSGDKMTANGRGENAYYVNNKAVMGKSCNGSSEASQGCYPPEYQRIFFIGLTRDTIYSLLPSLPTVKRASKRCPHDSELILSVLGLSDVFKIEFFVLP